MNGGFMNNDSELNQINLNTAWANYKINYLFGLPGLPNIIRGVYLYVLPTGFYFHSISKKCAFQPLFIKYENVQNLEFLVGTGTPYYNNFGLNKIDNLMQVTFLINNTHFSFRFEIVDSSMNLNYNQARRQELYMLLKNHGIFERFARPAQSVETAQRTPESREDVFAKIEQLSKLHQSGALTDEEFQRKKEELLKRI